MEEMLKNLVKEAVIEALNEYANNGVAMASTDGNGNGNENGDEKPTKPKPKPKPIEPDPIFGPSGFSLK